MPHVQRVVASRPAGLLYTVWCVRGVVPLIYMKVTHPADALLESHPSGRCSHRLTVCKEVSVLSLQNLAGLKEKIVQPVD